jgi:hypothetical protein
MTNREIRLLAGARRALEELTSDPAKAGLLKQLRKTLATMAADLRHPSLRTHKYISMKGPDGEDVFEAYAQNQTPVPGASSFSMAPTGSITANESRS